MGNRCCGESAVETQTIKIRENSNGKGELKLIKNKHSPYDGTLIQKVKTDGSFGIKVFRTKNVHGGNKNNAIVQMYSYTSIPPENDGTYVVLRFKESGMYFASREDKPEKLLLQKPGDFEPKDPKDITSPTDRRVFLKTKYSSEVLFKSMYASKVITLNQNIGTAAELEDNDKADSQRFQLFDANDEEADEQSEERHGQEVQRRD